MDRKHQKDTDNSKPTFSSKISNYYDNVKSRLLGNELTGRRHAQQENSFGAETNLTGFKRDQQEASELQLKPQNVDLCRPKNRESHHTAEYEAPNLIIRRGQPFEITVDFNRSFNKGQDHISLKFVTGSRPCQSRGSVITANQVDKLQSGQWGFELISAKDKSVTLRVGTSSDAIVGRYELFIDTTHQKPDGLVKFRHKNPEDIFLLFNPWNNEDTVCLPGEAQLKEFLLSETGRIWLGSAEKSYARAWNFGQFEDVCLIAATSIVDHSELADSARGNPVLVARAICRAINYTESSGGLIQASWSGKYDDAVAPNDWTGSPSILEEYLKTRKGVQYGQCWTMSAVATTLLRTLGIPSRCVTCYRAAHDSNFSGAINNHWSHDLKPRSEIDDGIWNFHVWNEAWFSRPDLPPGYDGWQALDPTPLDSNEGVVTCGPAPVKAILKGDLYLGFDTKFLFAKLNGESVHWQVDIHGDMEAFQIGGSVGAAVSTKATGTDSRENITTSYKHSDGSSDQKTVLEKAGKLCSRKIPPIVKSTKQDVQFNYSGSIDQAGDITLNLQVQNGGNEGRIVDLFLGVMSSFYTGVTSSELKKVVTSLMLEPRKEGKVSLELKYSEYVELKPTDSLISAYVFAKVRETRQRYANIQTLSADQPSMDVKTEGKVVQGQNFTVVVKLTNTLSVPLTNGVITLDGPGVSKQTIIKLKKQIEPGEELRETVSLTSRRSGVKEVIAIFNSQQIYNVSAAAEVNILKK